MATIKYYLDPLQPPEIEEAVSVAESLLKRWPGGNGVPPGLRIYRDTVTSATDITDDSLRNPKLLTLPSDGVYHCVVTAGEISTTALIIISLVIAVATVLLMPAIPGAPANANRTQQSPNNFLGARSNQPRVGQRSADIRGKQRNAYPDLLQVPYRRFRDGVEYEYIYAQIGEGYYALEDIKDGATEYARLGGRLAIYGPDTSPLSGVPQLIIGSGAPTELLYDATQSNEIDGATLLPPNADSVSDSVITASGDGTISTNSTTVDFTLSLTPGNTVTLTGFYAYVLVDPINDEYEQYDISGTYTIDTVGTDTFKILPTAGWALAFSTNDPQTILRTAWQSVVNYTRWAISDPASSDYVAVNSSPSIGGVGGAGAVGPASISGFDKILINVVAPNGLYFDNGTDTITATVIFNVIINELNAAGDRVGTPAFVESFNIDSNTTNARDSVGRSVDVVNPYQYAEVEVERTSETDKEFAGTVVDEIKWRDLYLLNDVLPADIDTSYATTVHAEIRATAEALRVKERKLNLTATRKVANYLGSGLFSATEDTITDLFAPVIASIWRDPLFGRGADDEVNWDNLFAVQGEMIAYYTDSDPCRVGYTFDSDKITAEDAIKLICDAVNVIPYRIGSVLNFWFERPQSQSAMFFGHRFKHPGTESRSRSFAPANDKTGVELTYFSEVTGAFETVTRGDQTNPLKVELPACITPRGAQIRADREWNKLRYSRVQCSFDATAIGRMAVPGMRIDVVDNTRRAPYDGEIRDVNGLTVTISQPVELPVPTDYSMVLTRADGTLEAISVASQPSADKLVLATAPAEPVRVSRLSDRTVYSIGTDDMRTKLAMLVREITPKDYNRVAIGAINYDDRYYSEDLTG